MYIPAHFAEHDRQVLFDFIEAHPLAALVTASPSAGLFATHLPLLLDRSGAESGLLHGHIARANPHYRYLADDSSDALVIFSGPDSYITPNWYESKREHGRVVPTWNYATVHAYGEVSLVEDPVRLRRHLEALTARHEAARDAPWHVTDAPDEFITRQLTAIVGLTLRISRLEGKWKMSQNRSQADVDGVVRGLESSGLPHERAVADVMKERRARGRAHR